MDDGKKEAFFGSDRFELLADTIGIVVQFQALSLLLNVTKGTLGCCSLSPRFIHHWVRGEAKAAEC